MPNLVGEYLLNEVAHELGVSTAWINKIQKAVGIANKIDTKGKRVSFSKKDIGVFRRVKLLRKLDYSLQDIKEIYEIEKKMIEFVGGEDSPDDLDNVISYIVHTSCVSMEMVCFVDSGGGGDENGESFEYDHPVTESWYKDDAKKILEISREVYRRLDRLKADIDKYCTRLKYSQRIDRLNW